MKVAICVPHHGDVKARFAECLANLVGTLAGSKITVVVLFEEDGSLDYKRTRLILRALEWGADYIQCIDSDHTFPPDATLRLLAHKKPIVGCNYLRRRCGRFTALGMDNEPVETTGAKAKSGELESVGAMGLGLCLMDASIFKTIAHPWFRTETSANGELYRGEDVHFFNQARRVGFQVFVDHGLSWSLGHIAERVLTIRDESAPSPGG